MHACVYKRNGMQLYILNEIHIHYRSIFIGLYLHLCNVIELDPVYLHLGLDR